MSKMATHHVTFDISRHREVLVGSLVALREMAELLDFPVVEFIMHPTYKFTKKRLFAVRDLAAQQMKLLAEHKADSTYTISRRDSEDDDNVGYDTMLLLSSNIEDMYEIMGSIKRRARKGARGRMRRITRTTRALVNRRQRWVNAHQWAYKPE